MAYADGLTGGKNYQLGKGMVLFDQFAAGAVVTGATVGSGERFLGNAPEFSLNSSGDSVDHYSSTGGIKIKDDSVLIQLNRSGKVTVDNIDKNNLALFFMGEAGQVAQTAQTALTHTIESANRGRYYQIGTSITLPAGVRNIASVVVKKGAGFTTTVSQSGNYDVDLALGRIYIEAGSTDIPDGTDIQVTYNTTLSTREQIITNTNAIYGSLRFIANNVKGVNRDYFFPYVKLSPDGDYNLIGDDWATMGFGFEPLVKDAGIAQMYIDGRGA